MRVVLAYGGSLRGSAALWRLRRHAGAEVVTVTLDVGRGRQLEAVRDRALALGAARAHVLDARDTFLRGQVLPALFADALHDGQVPLARALARPLVAGRVLELAAIERADAVAHTGGGTAVSVLDRLFADRAPAVRVLTPLREWALTPGDLESFALAHGLGTGDDGDDVDVNLWGRSWRPAAAHPVSTERLRAARVPAGAPASVAITFASGVPVLLNGVSLPLAELLTSLETLAVLHGVGHTSTSTLACDAPAAVVLHAAHRALAQAVYGPDLAGFAAGATAAWTQLVESGRWFSPLRGALDAFFAQAQQAMHGCVRLQLSQGTFTTLSTEPAPAPAIVPVSAAPSLAQH